MQGVIALIRCWATGVEQSLITYPLPASRQLKNGVFCKKGRTMEECSPKFIIHLWGSKRTDHLHAYDNGRNITVLDYSLIYAANMFSLRRMKIHMQYALL